MGLLEDMNKAKDEEVRGGQREIFSELERTPAPSKPVDSSAHFMERLKLGFGGPESRAEQQRIERESGRKGRLDIGDIADVAGAALPVAGAILGGGGGTILGTPVGGVTGAAIGATAGQAVKQAIGQSMGVREDVSALQEAKNLGKEFAITLGAGKIGSYIGSRIPKLLGIATGEGDDVIREALKNPKVADLGIKQGDDALRAAVQKGSEQSVSLRNAFLRGHTEAVKALGEQVPGDAMRAVNKGWMMQSFRDLLKSRGVKIGKDGSLDFTTSKIVANPGEVTKIQNAYQALQTWDDWSFSGINEFKQLVGQLTRFADDAGVASKSPTLGAFYRTLDNTIKRNLPTQYRDAYTEMNKIFADNIDLFDDMVDAFNKGDAFTKLANVFGKNKDTLRQVLEFYERKSGEKVLPVVAGRELATEKAAAFGLLNPRSWIDFFWSPEMQARMITRLGKIGAPIGRGVKAYQEAVRGLLPPTP